MQRDWVVLITRETDLKPCDIRFPTRIAVRYLQVHGHKIQHWSGLEIPLNKKVERVTGRHHSRA